MFQESPFSGACAISTYEVVVMLAGTFGLGVLLGYLIWGWLKKKIRLLEASQSHHASIATARLTQVGALNTRVIRLQEELERAGTRISFAEYRLRRALEEVTVLREEAALHGHHESPDGILKTEWDGGEEPSLADLTQAMEANLQDDNKMGTDASSIPEALRRGTTPEALAIAEQIYGRSVIADDLQLLHGVGPKLEEILHRAGIRTWADLAQMHLPDLRHVLEHAGPTYGLVDPKTWPVQARMAARGEWRKLRAYQETLPPGGE